MWYLEPKWLRCLLWRLLTGYRFPCRKRTKKIHGTSITWGDHLRSNTLMRSNPSILHTGIWGVHRNGSLHSKWITAKINKRPCETHWPDVVPWAKMATVLKGPLIDWLSFRMRKTIQKKKKWKGSTQHPRDVNWWSFLVATGSSTATVERLQGVPTVTVDNPKPVENPKKCKKNRPTERVENQLFRPAIS